MNEVRESDIRKMPDKIMHCLARTIQDMETESCVKCLFCKYAFECNEEFQKTKKLLTVDLLNELQTITGVELYESNKDKSINHLNGSWVENYPELYKVLTNKCVEEQQDILTNPDILKYAGRK